MDLSDEWRRPMLVDGVKVIADPTLTNEEIMLFVAEEKRLWESNNKKLGQLLLKRSGVEKLSLPVPELSDDQILKIAFLIKNYDIKIIETTGFRNAQVTAGGVITDDINPGTMESKKIKGLYFAGEIIDVDAYTGGFNLQIAYSTGYVAGMTHEGQV